MPDIDEKSSSNNNHREIEDLIKQTQQQQQNNKQPDNSLHSYVKLAITYMGLMVAFVIISLVYHAAYVIYVNETEASVVSSAYYIMLIIVPSAAIAGLVNRKKMGAYFTFAALATSLSLFVIIPNNPVGRAAGEIPMNVILPLLIPHAIVGLLLCKALKTLT